MFLSETQKEEIIFELRALQCSNENSKKIIQDIKTKGAKSEYLSFTDPDNQQVAVEISEDIWIYSQQDKFMYDWTFDSDCDVKEYRTETMNLGDYVESDMDTGNGALEEVKKIYKDDWKQIVLENLFEENR